MNRMKYTAALAIAVSLLLSACGGSTETAGTSAETTQPVETETTIEATEEKVEEPDTTEPVIVEGLESPESAEFHEGVVYASNMGGNEADFTTVDGNGFISTYSPDGTMLEKKFLPADDTVLNSPKAMTVAGNTLLTVDLDRIVGFDLDTKETVIELNLASEGVTFLNGIELKDDNTVFVSDTPLGAVFEVSLTDETFTKVDVEPINGANGLAYDPADDKLFVSAIGLLDDLASGGEVGVITFEEGTSIYEKFDIAKPGNADGIVLIDDHIVYSSWDLAVGTGELYSYNLSDGSVTELPAVDGVAGYADGDLDPTTNTFWGGTLFGQQLVGIPLEIE